MSILPIRAPFKDQTSPNFPCFFAETVQGRSRFSAPEGAQIHPVTTLGARQVRLHNNWVPQVLIQWDGVGDCTWEPLSYIQDQFPQLDLEDKVFFYEEGNVMI